MEILERLFGSAARIKLMRLFLMNPEDVFDRKEMMRRSKVNSVQLSKEVRLLKDVGLVKPGKMLKLIPRQDGKDGEMEKIKIEGLKLDPAFPFMAPLRALVTEIALGKEDVSARFRNVGNVKLIIVAGVFIDEIDSRVDILIVGDKLKRKNIEQVLRRLEAELGKELVYGVMDTTEFEYRFGIYDKFVRDIIDYPHLVVQNKLNLF